MIVRISGDGQFELDDGATHRLEELDHKLTSALHANQEQEFHQQLQAIIGFVREQGKEIGHDRIVPSDVIVPPDDVTLEEAHRLLTDDSLMHPLPA